jgi:dihydrofolate synthase/folylpolyglutamate synthase
MDIRQIAGKTLVMDGAHNAQKMEAFVQSFQHLYPGVKPALLIGLKEGKEYQSLIPILAPLADRIIVTVFNTSQDLPAHSMDPEVLAEAFRAAGLDQVETFADQHQAYQALVTGPEDVCILTGSFYLLSQIRNKEQLV